MTLSKVLRKAGHFKMAEDAHFLELKVNDLQSEIESLRSLLRASEDDCKAKAARIAQLKDVRYNLNQIVHSCNAAMERIKAS